MAKRGNLLDDVQIRRWIAKGDPLARSDGEGLTFTLSNAGTASWVLRYRIGAGRRKNSPSVTTPIYLLPPQGSLRANVVSRSTKAKILLRKRRWKKCAPRWLGQCEI